MQIPTEENESYETWENPKWQQAGNSQQFA
jgi:hypothetical protein